MQHQSTLPLFSVLAFLGTGLLFAGTLLHPMHADPNIAAEAFAEYAADRHWVVSHLLQLAGLWAMIGALVLLARRLEEGPARSWARLGAAVAIASMATAAALQAVDGVALKAMVDRWTAAPEPEKTALFAAAFGVRQIEIGLASMNSLLLGFMAAIVGTAVAIDGRLPRWTGLIGIAGGIATTASGIVIAYTGFSAPAMAIGMPANLALMAWLIALAVLSWKRALT
ncbi:hypothetical protein [Microvirga terricola]|uniref:DUF4386 family protein n=1 Tax=Microvirga terricola TaxID=2719797 RepID=A0ABX0VGI9_9HYPH|nr:hypothetical protein [Microvirga terricola]NIX77187.1 hypothetical protein [Microvirga terricola]